MRTPTLNFEGFPPTLKEHSGEKSTWMCLGIPLPKANIVNVKLRNQNSFRYQKVYGTVLACL